MYSTFSFIVIFGRFQIASYANFNHHEINQHELCNANFSHHEINQSSNFDHHEINQQEFKSSTVRNTRIRKHTHSTSQASIQYCVQNMTGSCKMTLSILY
jgi:hypothetical protein